ncbi:MAG: alcohol dehydrogenase catalytic domain-containing protein [Balneolaceae bacterium]|nr:alcohol dehydrogenase catalytic domain-containing protein [Balneolaceae bacterium]
MKAFTFQGIRQAALEDIAEPSIQEPGDAIVKVERAALCGSDMHIYHGRETGLDRGTVMGHEFTGRVAEIGKGVQRFSEGDPVISPFTVNCGSCDYCREGLTARCRSSRLFGWVEDGEGLHGAHAEYVRVPMADATLLAKPGELSWEQAVLMGDNLPTGWFCAEMAEIGPGDSCAVVGCGPIGLMCVMAAQFRGAEKIFALDAIPLRLEKARELGAVPVDIREADHRDRLREACGGRGVGKVLEAVGSRDSMRDAFELLRPGGILATVGVQAYGALPFKPPEIYDKNLTLKAGRCSARRYAEELLSQAAAGAFPLESVITHTIPLNDALEAYRLFDTEKGACIKVLLQP